MKKQRKLLVVLLSAVMVFCMFPQMAFAEIANNEPSVDCTHTDENSDGFCDQCFKYCGSEPTTKQDVKLVLERESQVEFHVGKDGTGGKIFAENKGYNEDEKCYIYEIEVPDGGYSCTVRDENVNWGGIGFDMPLQTSIYEDTSIKLLAVKYYTTTSSVKVDGANVPVNIDSVDDFDFEITAPGKCEIIPGENYLDSTIESGKTYVVAPRMVWAYGNQILYNYVAKLKGDLANTMGSPYQINQTYPSTTTSVLKKKFSIQELSTFTLNVPASATVKFYHQINNFNNTVIDDVTAANNGDGTSTYTVKYPSFSNATYRVTQEGYVTAAGYAKDKTTYTVTTDMDAVEADKSNSNRSVYPFRKDDSGQLTKSTDTIVDTKAGEGSNIEYENSVCLNIDDTKDTNELSLNVGETFRLRAFRAAWEIVNTVTGNIMIEPDMHYEVLTGQDVVSVTPVTNQCTGNAKDNWMDVKALKEGTALIAVWYDAIDIGGNTSLSGIYGATDPSRYGYVLVNVGMDKNITWNPISHDDDWDAEFDTVYYYGDNGTFSFDPDNASRVTVQNINSINMGTVTEVTQNDGKYNVPVTSGSNLITVETADGTDYMLVRAKKITYTIENKTTGKTSNDEDFSVRVGDKLCVHFNQFNMPIPKMSGIYNPGWMSTAKTCFMLNNKYAFTSVGTQYDYITDAKSCINFTAYIPGENTLSGGYIQSGSMGDDFGNHRNITDAGRGTNFSAINKTGYFGSIEDITFNVEESEDASVDYDALVKIKNGGSILLGATNNNNAGKFSISNTTKDNNYLNYSKTTQAISNQSDYGLRANIQTVDYYTELELRYWYEGDEKKVVPMISGVETVVPQEVIKPNADKILNVEVVVKPVCSDLGPEKVYSFVFLPGKSNLKYVHPIFKGLTASAEEGATAVLKGEPLRYTTENGRLEMYTTSDTVTLTGEMLQKYTNKTNKTQDNSDKVTVQRYNKGQKVGEEIVVQEPGGYPTGTWTSDIDTAGIDQLKLVATSYVDNQTSRSIDIDVHHMTKFTLKDASAPEGEEAYFMCNDCKMIFKGTQMDEAVSTADYLKALEKAEREQREAFESQLEAEKIAREEAERLVQEAYQKLQEEKAAREALEANLEAPYSVNCSLYGYDDVKATWSKVPRADGYYVYYKKSTSSKYTYAGKTTSTSFKLANLKDGAKYYVRVYPCIKDDSGKLKRDDSYRTSSIRTLKKVSSVKAVRTTTKVKVSWSNIYGESGYQISRSTKKTGTNIVKTYNTYYGKSYKVKAKKGKTYYYKVRAYKTVSGKKIYGPWSTAVKYKR